MQLQRHALYDTKPLNQIWQRRWEKVLYVWLCVILCMCVFAFIFLCLCGCMGERHVESVHIVRKVDMKFKPSWVHTLGKITQRAEM